jgi:hypothetical protein
MEADVDKEGGLSFIRGHGTYQEDAAERGSSVGVESKAGKVRLCAGVAGVIERVNKLVTVVPPNTRYQVRTEPDREEIFGSIPESAPDVQHHLLWWHEVSPRFLSFPFQHAVPLPPHSLPFLRIPRAP